MDCKQASNLISARLDGQLASIDATALDSHLATCAECRSLAESLAIQHAQLIRAFGPRRRSAAAVADRVIEQLPTRSHSTLRWISPLAAAAAGFLLAMLIFQPWARRQPATSRVDRPNPALPGTAATSIEHQSKPVAHLALATGKVEIQFPGSAGWHAMETGGEVPPNARVRTGPSVRCEFQMANGAEIRLNEKTELQFVAARSVELAHGQVWSGVPKSGQEFTFTCPQAVVTAQDVRCDVSSREGNARLVVFDGNTHVKGRKGEASVSAGQQVEISDGRVGTPGRMYDLALAERWADEILILKGRDNPELAAHVNDLLAQMGNEKLRYMYESEIRALGDHCVLPLTRYIESERSKDDPNQRRRAARIVADCAQPWCIPYLIELLSDRDGDVRASAAEGLRRLVGEEFADSGLDWRTAPPAACEKETDRWRLWWDQNKGHIPASGGSRPSVTPDKGRGSKQA